MALSDALIARAMLSGINGSSVQTYRVSFSHDYIAVGGEVVSTVQGEEGLFNVDIATLFSNWIYVVNLYVDASYSTVGEGEPWPDDFYECITIEVVVGDEVVDSFTGESWVAGDVELPPGNDLKFRVKVSGDASWAGTDLGVSVSGFARVNGY